MEMPNKFFFITPRQKVNISTEKSECWRICGNHEANRGYQSNIPFQFNVFLLGNTDFHLNRNVYFD